MPDPIYINLSAISAEVECEISGILTSNVFGSPLEVFTEIAYGSGSSDNTDNVPVIISETIFSAEVSFGLWFIKLFAANPVIWRARTGTTDFIIYESEQNKPLGAGKTYLENFGWVYAIKKLGNSMIAYGQNSVMAMMHIDGAKWGRKTIHPVGLKSFGSVCADNEFNPSRHWCIDKANRLLLVTKDGVSEISNYSNWLSLLGSNACMFYDENLKVVRIADGDYGFTYSNSGLGWGSPVISGLGFRDGESYIVSPNNTITTPPLSFVTDIFDLGSRRTKHIHRVDFGSDFILNAALDYKWNSTVGWISTPWVNTDFNGSAFIQCAGVEFRLKGRLLDYKSGQIDYAEAKVRYDEIAEVFV